MKYEGWSYTYPTHFLKIASSGIRNSFLNTEQSKSTYGGHSRINDNEFISRKVLLESVFFVMPYEDAYINYLCLKFGAFIMASFDAMII